MSFLQPLSLNVSQLPQFSDFLVLGTNYDDIAKIIIRTLEARPFDESYSFPNPGLSAIQIDRLTKNLRSHHLDLQVSSEQLILLHEQKPSDSYPPSSPRWKLLGESSKGGWGPSVLRAKEEFNRVIASIQYKVSKGDRKFFHFLHKSSGNMELLRRSFKDFFADAEFLVREEVASSGVGLNIEIVEDPNKAVIKEHHRKFVAQCFDLPLQTRVDDSFPRAEVLRLDRSYREVKQKLIDKLRTLEQAFILEDVTALPPENVERLRRNLHKLGYSTSIERGLLSVTVEKEVEEAADLSDGEWPHAKRAKTVREDLAKLVESQTALIYQAIEKGSVSVPKQASCTPEMFKIIAAHIHSQTPSLSLALSRDKILIEYRARPSMAQVVAKV